MKNRILISVIMPVYNEEDYVQQAINSILRQTFTHLELIIINDASTDRSDQLIRSFTDSRLVYVNNPRQTGNYRCRNQGAKLARGKYLAVMDADDIACPERLEKQFLYLESHKEVLAVGSDRITLPGKVYTPYPHTYEEILLALLKDNAFVHPSITLRADAFRRLGGYDEHYPYAADYDLACRLALSGQIVNLPEALMYYRRHLQQISQQHWKEQAACAAEIRQRYQQEFINHFRSGGQPIVCYTEIAASKIGRAIAYYTFARYSGQETHRQQAEEVLDEVISALSVNMPLRLEQGLLGIASGLVYLIRNGFVKGNEDEVLAEIDKKFFAQLYCLTNKSEVAWYDLLYYAHLRLSYRPTTSRGLLELEFRKNVIYLLDCLVRSTKKGFSPDERVLKEIAWFHGEKICPATTGLLLSGQTVPVPALPLSACAATRFTILIPIRMDSREREGNLETVLAELIDMEEVDINILEADHFPRYRQKVSSPRIHYQFIEDHNPVFYRTHYLNLLLQKANSDIVGIWDADVVVPKEQIRTAVHAIATARAVMAYPYDGRFISLSPEVSDTYRASLSPDVIRRFLQSIPSDQGFYSVGGAFLVNRKRYLQAGGENEHFYGWGAEDMERVKRMEILGLPIYRATGALYHLYHPRNENSRYRNRELKEQSLRELLRVCSMTREELEKVLI